MQALARFFVGSALLSVALVASPAQAVQYIKAPGVGTVGHEQVGHVAIGLAPTPRSNTPSGSATVGNIDGVITNGTSVGTLLRWPALPKYTDFQLMDGPNHDVAYFRDAFTALRYVAVGTHDGETWQVTADLTPSPTSSSIKTIQWPTLTFYQQLSGVADCWYSPGWAYYICGTNEMQITAYRASQCSDYGTWTYTLADDSTVVGTQSFTMLGSVPPEDLSLISQGSLHSYDGICYSSTNRLLSCDTNSPPPGETPYTIKAKGCAMTATDMVLAYHGFGSTVDTLDDTLVSMGKAGFDKNGSLEWAYPGAVTGSQVEFIHRDSGMNDAALKQNICKYGPQVMGVKVGSGGYIGHWVMVAGRTDDDQSWKIYDPGDTVNGPRSLATAYGGIYGATVSYKGQAVTYVDPLNQIWFKLFSPAELLVTDPAGNRTGIDPATNKTYSEIPNSAYDAEGLDDDVTGAADPDPVKVFSIAPAAPQGDYTVQVTGTGTGTYTLEAMRYDVNGKFQDSSQVDDVPITPGEVHIYSVDYSTSSSSQLVFAGGFCGRSNNPAVNKFLCYGNPGQASVSLPAGTKTFRLMITYGSTTIANTFSAAVNGTSIASLFSPAPGKTETVMVPLAAGRNVLDLSISGTSSSGRIATDTDRLVMSVP